MKPTPLARHQRGFTLMETVIAIGVLSVLLTSFMIVFMPAADGIKKSMTMQEADRLVSALEQELVTLRPNDEDPDKYGAGGVNVKTGFDKAFSAIWKSTGQISANLDQGSADDCLLVYQYRADQQATPRADGTLQPLASIKDKVAGEDYTVTPMMRRVDDPLFLDEDLPAIEGTVYIVKCAQMVYVPDSGQFALQPVPAPNPTGPKQRGNIYDPTPNSSHTAITDPSLYPDAVLAFAAEFYPVPSKAKGFFSGQGFADFYERSVKPTFTRNLAIRR
jgi:prepilin-type N-terminal cleavage/methylation domain-containing protein